MVDPKKIRPDVHERFLRICAREEATYAMHLERLRQMPERPLEGDAEWVLKALRQRALVAAKLATPP